MINFVKNKLSVSNGKRLFCEFNLKNEFSKKNLKKSFKWIKCKILFKTLGYITFGTIFLYYIKEKQIYINPINNKEEVTYINDKIKSFISSFFFQIIISDYNTIDINKNKNFKFILNSIKNEVGKIVHEDFNIDIEINEIIPLNYDIDIFYILDNGKILISSKCLEDFINNKKLLKVMVSLEISSLLLNNYFINKNIIHSLYYNYVMINTFTNNIQNQTLIINTKKIYCSEFSESCIDNCFKLLEKNLLKNDIKNILKESKYFNQENLNLNFLRFSNRYNNIFN